MHTSSRQRIPEGQQRVEPYGWARRLGAVALMLALYSLIQWLTLVLAIYPHLGLPEHLTQRGSWVRAVDHHLWQMVLALGVIGVLGRGRWHAWGLNLRHREESLRILGRFCYYYGLYFVGIGFLVQLLFISPPALDHPWSPTHILGRLAFGFLFVGLSEEILFRGMIHTYLARYWTRVWRWRGIEMPVAGFIATLIFTLAHITFRLSPFEITHLYAPQLLFAVVLGLYYSAVYHHTGSLLNPILAHNFSDGTLWVSEYLLVALRAGGSE